MLSKEQLFRPVMGFDPTLLNAATLLIHVHVHVHVHVWLSGPLVTILTGSTVVKMCFHKMFLTICFLCLMSSVV